MFYGLSHDAMVGEYVLSYAHNFNFTLEFATSFCPSYFMAQEVSIVCNKRRVAMRQTPHRNNLNYIFFLLDAALRFKSLQGGSLSIRENVNVFAQKRECVNEKLV